MLLNDEQLTSIATIGTMSITNAVTPSPNALTFRAPDGEKILYIDQTGMAYKGQRIEDADL